MKTSFGEILFGNDYVVQMIAECGERKHVLGVCAYSVAHATHKAINEMKNIKSECMSVDYIKKL